MQVQTRWLGKPVSPGQQLEVDDGVAERWLGSGIAAYPPAKAPETPAQADEPTEGIPDSFPGAQALRSAGYDHPGQLAQLSKHELMEIKGVGEATADSIMKKLA